MHPHEKSVFTSHATSEIVIANLQSIFSGLNAFLRSV
jgi:hypothetical protein